MRIFSAVGLACAAYTLVQCQTRRFYQSDTKNTDTVSSGKGASSIIADFSGTYTVMCKNGNIEHAVSKARIDAGDYCGQKPQPLPQVDTQGNPKVKPLAFNAFNIWRDGAGTPVFNFPAGYEVHGGYSDSDGVFYVSMKTLWHNGNFLGSVTEGAKVEGDLLTYPKNDGQSLALKFSAPAEKKLTHAEASQYCKDRGLRLPHFQEIFDFCAAGTPKDNNGRYRNNRCGKSSWWSTSLPTVDLAEALQFSGYDGYVYRYSRNNYNDARCVSAP
jgi:hypothetical protein